MTSLPLPALEAGGPWSRHQQFQCLVTARFLGGRLYAVTPSGGRVQEPWGLLPKVTDPSHAGSALTAWSPPKGPPATTTLGHECGGDMALSLRDLRYVCRALC